MRDAVAMPGYREKATNLQSSDKNRASRWRNASTYVVFVRALEKYTRPRQANKTTTTAAARRPPRPARLLKRKHFLISPRFIFTHSAFFNLQLFLFSRAEQQRRQKHGTASAAERGDKSPWAPRRGRCQVRSSGVPWRALIMSQPSKLALLFASLCRNKTGQDRPHPLLLRNSSGPKKAGRNEECNNARCPRRATKSRAPSKKHATHSHLEGR